METIKNVVGKLSSAMAASLILATAFGCGWISGLSTGVNYANANTKACENKKTDEE